MKPAVASDWWQAAAWFSTETADPESVAKAETTESVKTIDVITNADGLEHIQPELDIASRL